MARLKGLGFACLALLSLGPRSEALAQTRDADWLRKPNMQDLMGVWPTGAMKSGRGGKARIDCTVTVQGTLRNCTVLSEKPAGEGFGAAGLALASQFVMKPALRDGKPVEGPVTIPIEWPDMRAGSLTRLGNPDADGITNRVVSNVPWSQAPSVDDVIAAYPPKARAAKVGGRATLDCTLTKTGTLSRCNVLQEEPNAYGFSAAARQLVPKFVGPTTDGKGAALAGAHVQLPFVFAAESLSAAARVIGRPQWAALPTGDDLMAAYPRDAAKAGVLKARVVLKCDVIADGALSDCAVESEDPAGYGVGKATMALAPTFRLGIWTPEGLPAIGGSVRIPIRYDITDKAPAKP